MRPSGERQVQAQELGPLVTVDFYGSKGVVLQGHGQGHLRVTKSAARQGRAPQRASKVASAVAKSGVVSGGTRQVPRTIAGKGQVRAQ